MATVVVQPRLAPQILSMLAGLRRRIIAYVWTEGLAVGVAWLGIAFWVSLAVDWTIEPPVWFRQGMLGLAAIGLVYLLYRFIFRRLWLPIADHNLALVLERRFREFDESLLTTVELTEQPDHASAFHPQMLAAAEHAAIRRMAGVRLGEVFRRGPLLRSLLAAALAILSVAAYAWAAPKSFGIWESRVLPPFSNQAWPRRVHLSIEGFDNSERRVVVAKGADLTVVAKADTQFEIPDTVQIRYRTEEGRSKENMSRVGIAGPEDPYQPYSFTFRGILSSRTFDIFGGDAALRDYRIDVVDVPTIALVLHCEYPKYTGIGDRDLPARSVEVAQGSRITIHATANKDLADASIQRLTGDKADLLATIHLHLPVGPRYEEALHRLQHRAMTDDERIAVDEVDKHLKQFNATDLLATLSNAPDDHRIGDDVLRKVLSDLVDLHLLQTTDGEIYQFVEGDLRHFSYTIDRLDDTQTLLFSLFDTDGIHSREPIRLNLTARPDEPPRVGVHFRGIGSAVTPNARLPLEGDITDDYGLAKLWYEFKFGAEGKLEEADAVKVPLATDPRNRTKILFDRQSTEAIDLNERGLKIGQQLVVAINAEDNCTLGKTPNFGPGEKYQLAVVSPEQLLSILEARELTLRMRLESVVQDVTISRDRLARLDFAPPARKPAAKPSTEKPSTEKPSAEKPSAEKPSAEKPSAEKPSAAKPAAVKPATSFSAPPVSPFVAGDAGSEPGDAPIAKSSSGSEPGDEANSGSGLSAAPVVVQQAVANAEQSASETLALATSFDDIREELVNNRIDTPELEARLKDQIGDPLRQIAEKSFPELESRLRKLETVLADPATAKGPRENAVKQADEILAEMHQVLNKMLELESFNEVVEQLRDIIQTEKAIQRDTLKRQREKTLKLND